MLLSNSKYLSIESERYGNMNEIIMQSKWVILFEKN